MQVFSHPSFRDHEQVVFCRDRGAGLSAIIAIHSTTLGPAAGGCRMYPYPDEAAALDDVLRLSHGMTYKNALAGLPLGGGKSVIVGDPRTEKTPELLAAFGRFITGLGGRYWTAEDVGVGESDVERIHASCPYVFGLSNAGQHTGDPAPFTARGVFQGLRAAVRVGLGRTELRELRVAIQGVGAVGFGLGRLLSQEGARLVIADADPRAVERAREELGAEVDVFAPCALGGTVNRDTVRRLKARVVAGAANNQLADAAVGRLLVARGITYAPDFVVNAGGMLNASGDILGSYVRNDVLRRIDGLYDVTVQILEEARRRERPSEDVALEMAELRIAAARRGPVPREGS